MTAPPRAVLVAGATGLVGGALLGQLADAPGIGEVRALTRRPLPSAPPRVRVAVVDGGGVAGHAVFDGVDAIFCALGTTIRKAGSEEAFRDVDQRLVAAVARAGRAAGARHFLVVTALGAHPRSRVFYNRVKGEVEEELRGLGYPSLTIVRPSLLLGERAERRSGEEIGKRLAWLVPPRWRPVAAADVARAMVRALREERPGVRVMENRELRGCG